MLSSFASFLPSALHINGNNDLPRPAINPDDPQTDDEDDRRSLPPQREGYSEQLKSKDGKGPSETFVFVRPPPSKTNHPLNLQVQLVPPNTKPPTGVGDAPTTPTSASSSASGSDGTSLHRTASNRSQTSSFNNSSTTSFSSIASSTTSSGSSRRMIIPLYNLQAHNVMTNVIVDAGTDAKIAKFQKRGIELIDLALLEPVEVWGEKDKSDKDIKRESMRITVDEMGAMVTNLSSTTTRGSGFSTKPGGSLLQTGSGSRPTTPSATSSAVSLNSQIGSAHGNSSGTGVGSGLPPARESPLGGNRNRVPSGSRTSIQSDSRSSQSPQPSVAPTPISPPPTKRNIFGKFFNKRNSGVPTPSSSNIPTPVGTPVGASPIPSDVDTAPNFAAFALHPAPTAKLDISSRDVPPAKINPPRSPISPTSQETTPTQTPRLADEEPPMSPTPTLQPSKGHSRNISLTGLTTPIKASLKNNRNRLSGLMGASSPANASPLGFADTPSSELKVPDGNRKRDASPNPSVARSNRSRLSWVGTSDTHSTESSGTPRENTSHTTMLTQSQAQLQAESNPGANLRQQQLQLRPPILGIQPTFVSATPSTAQSAIPGGVASPLVSVLSPRVAERDQESVSLQGQRALMYVWLVRRWLKKRPGAPSGLLGLVSGHSAEGSVGGAVGGLFGKKKEVSSHSGHVHAQEPSAGGVSMMGGGSGSGPAHLAYGGVEVRFEWKRAKGKELKKSGSGKRRGRSRNRTASGVSTLGGAESDGEIERASVREQSRDIKERLKKEDKKRNRMSTGSFSTTNASEEGGLDSSFRSSRQLRRQGTRSEVVDDGDDSDPEDSETPWVCTLKIRRSAAAAAAAAAGVPHNLAAGLLSPTAPAGPSGLVPLDPQIIRIKVGTLSPTPHHPKVVAMLKVPFPLPDVEFERMGIVKRDAKSLAAAQQAGEKEPYEGLTLTAEEIKDVVCSTGLWLVVREGFGGVGKVSRKGDGWRIRA